MRTAPVSPDLTARGRSACIGRRIFIDGSLAKVVRLHKKLAVFQLQGTSSEFSCALRTRDNFSVGAEFEVLRHPDEVGRRKARQMARAASPGLRSALIELGEDMELAFDAMDEDGNGMLSAAEMQSGFERFMDRGINRRELRTMLAAGGDLGAGLSWKMFTAVIGNLSASRQMAERVRAQVRDASSQPPGSLNRVRTSVRASQTAVARQFTAQLSSNSSALARAFTDMDTDGDGVLSAEELLRGLKSHGVKLSKSQVRELVAMADTDGDGEIDYQVRLTLPVPCYSSSVVAHCVGAIFVAVFRFQEFLSIATSGDDDFQQESEVRGAPVHVP
jgi:Ca2+-binding EF-hand superfamily protein